MLPAGIKTRKTVAKTTDLNVNGSVRGDWIFAQMDLAALDCAMQLSEGRASTVAVEHFNFKKPVSLGEELTCFVEHVKTGKSSMTFKVEAWTSCDEMDKAIQVTTSTFIFVAIDKHNNPRKILNQLSLSEPLFLNEVKKVAPVNPTLQVQKNIPIFTFLFSLMANLSGNTLLIIIGCSALCGGINLPLLASASLIGTGVVGIGFFAHSIKSLNITELVDSMNAHQNTKGLTCFT